MSPADPGGARVLELGCAGGGNLIPMAWYLPRATFLGIDRAAASLGVGRSLAERLALSNLELRQADIATIDPATLGEFDYILVHGVWSWVSAAVQEQILRVCGACLAPQGIAYVSYNTLPGWYPRSMVRDLLLYHTRTIRDPVIRLTAARGLLERLAVAWAGDESPLAHYLAREVAELRRVHPGYLFHEYLGETNTPILFAEFMHRASQYGLGYLAEAELHTMFSSTLPEGAMVLVDSLEDLLDQEQHMDFLRYRHSRKTLLCREETPLQHDLDLTRLREFSISALLSPVQWVDLTQTITEDFGAPDGARFSVTHPLTKAALLHLAEVYPDAVAYPVLEEAAIQRVVAAGATKWEVARLNEELFSLYVHQAIRLATAPEAIYHSLSSRPRTHALARAQADTHCGHLATVRHTVLDIDPLAGQLIQLMDGTRNLDELVAELVVYLAHHTARAVVKGELAELPPEGQLLAGCKHLMELFARHGLLEDPAKNQGSSHVQPIE